MEIENLLHTKDKKTLKSLENIRVMMGIIEEDELLPLISVSGKLRNIHC